ncbi:hypothetical protein SOASR032_32350 [Pragia fontium]|uniref:Transposase n=1 Tax=Pragia fontium TaxID=82985 RepID=A0ABQ5LM05_9GAMM|nr:hypothetical protein SOASR032_32350 [Pragia fontium]
MTISVLVMLNESFTLPDRKSRAVKIAKKKPKAMKPTYEKLNRLLQIINAASVIRYK